MGLTDLALLEAFALGDDRATALAQLVPGTEDYYYYHCLHYQHTGQLIKSDELLRRWIERHGHTERSREVGHRQAILCCDSNQAGCLSYLRQVLDLHFEHEREAEQARRALPTAIRAEDLDRRMLAQRALERHRDLAGFTDHALDWLVAEPLDPARRRQLLARLQRPDHPGLVALVLADLEYAHSGGFGSLAIHNLLLLDQLDELGHLRPSLLGEQAFVHAYLARLQPGPDTDWEHDSAARGAYLDRLWAFAGELGPAFNSLKTHVLHHRLVLDRSLGHHDRERFLAYLRLPRRVGYMAAEYLGQPVHRNHLAELGAGFPTGLPVVQGNDDEKLVRDYLQHFLTGAEDYEAFAPYVRDDYLRAVFATANILAGIGDGERWYALLDDPARYQALKERVDIDLAATNKTYFRAGEPVVLEAFVKNVPALVVKVFEINTLGYYLGHDREIDTAIDLDGLVASQAETHQYSEPPLRRVRRRFALDSITRPGVYVVELIGNGKSSRALLRMGRLRYVERLGAAGHVLTILDEDGRVVRQASVWLGGREHQAREDGTIVVPYTTSPGRVTMLLCHGDLTTREILHHQAERYHFSAGIYVDREQLMAGRTAEILVRPTLRLNSASVSLALIQEPALVIETVDQHGVRASKEVAGFTLHGDRESVYAFQVPPALAELTIRVRGKVRSLIESRELALADQASYAVGGMDRSSAVEGFHLARTAAGSVLYLLGKSGEPRQGEQVVIVLRHRDFQDTITLDLQTDAAGRIELGPLPGITSLVAQRPAGTSSTAAASAQWVFPRRHGHCPSVVHAHAGETLALPYPSMDEGRISLLERRGDAYVADWSSVCRLADGYVHIGALPAGNYELWLAASDQRVTVGIAAGQTHAGTAAAEAAAQPGPENQPARWPAGWLIGATRMLEQSPTRFMQITSVQVGDEVVEVRLAQVSRMTRVHVFGSRFVPAHALGSALGKNMPPDPAVVPLHRSVSRYVSGREIGDEHRYVLERRQAPRFAGSMLERPGLLLNPWAVRKTDMGHDRAREGEAWAALAEPAPSRPPPPAPGAPPARPTIQAQASIDFLADAPFSLLNVRPELAESEADTGTGVVRIARSQLSGCNMVRILALDGATYAYREVALPEVVRPPRDLRLAAALDVHAHLVEKKQITALLPGEALTIADPATARVEVLDTLARVFELFATLSRNATLAEFRFVLRWPELDDSDKRARYSKYACHELSLFLWAKDPEFFERVIRPYLASKLHKTFLDDFLLGNDLSAYRELWAHGRLNTLERILLGRRVPGEAEPMQRHIEDRFDLLPPDPERDDRLFRTVLQGRALDEGGGGGSAVPALFRKTARPDTGEIIAEADEEAAEEADGRFSTRAGSVKSYAPQGVAGFVPAAMAAPAAASAPAKRAVSFGRPPAPAQYAARDDMDAMLSREAEYADQDVAERSRMRRAYRPADKTEEWAENNYYRLRIHEQGPGLIPVNAFWRDFARHTGQGPFLSPHVAQAAGSFAEMMCALAVLDLPFTAEHHEITRADTAQDTGLRMRAASPAIVFHQEIKPADWAKPLVPIQVGQQYVRVDDAHEYEGGEQRTKYVTGEFLVHTVYQCHVVLANPTAAPQALDVLLQIPAGAVPVDNGFVTRGQHVRLGGYDTQSLVYSFYFPAPGEYEHYPVHVAKGQDLVAAAQPATLAVVERPSQVDTGSWAHVSQHGSTDQVLEHLRKHNIERLELDKLAWRMGDAGVYKAVLALLDQRHVYHRTLWSYSFVHGDLPRVAELLRHESAFLRACGPALRSSLVTIDPVEQRWYEHLEYAPLIHARAHELGGQRKILNQTLADQYRRFLDILACLPAPSSEQRLAAAYYLLLQDRIGEGLAMLERVQPDAIRARLPYDYMQAVAALYRGDLARARQLAGSLVEHPIDRWRKRFEAVLATVDEAMAEPGAQPAAQPAMHEDGKEPEPWMAEQTRLAHTQPSFDMTIERGAIELTYQSLARCRVNYYLMDIELLFSRQPFVAQASERFSTVKPDRTDVIELPAGRAQHGITIPDEYRRRNIVVEVVAEGLRKAQGHYAHELLVQLVQPYGQLRVHEEQSRRPLPETYVKVYARTSDGDVMFYKDGYTDVRGCFDYASLSTNELERVERFAVLVLSDKHGAMVREVAPPAR